MDKYFFENSEEECWANLVKFQEEYNVFSDITRTKGKWYSDSTGYTINKLGEIRKFNIEIKNRKQILLDDGTVSGCSKTGKLYKEETIMIESHKAGDLFFDNIIGLEPLYVNFLIDGSVIIFNLNKLKKLPEKSETMNIMSRGYGKMEMAKRRFLYISDAAIYKNGKLIKKAGEEWKTQQNS